MPKTKPTSITRRFLQQLVRQTVRNSFVKSISIVTDFLPPPTRTLGDEFAKALNSAAANKTTQSSEADKKPKRAQKKKKGIVLAF